MTKEAELQNVAGAELDELRHEIDELRASRRRLLAATDHARRTIERELHAGVHQHLVALAVELQHAEARLVEDPAEARVLLAELRRDIQLALDETARLAQRIYPSLLEARGVAAAVRAVAANSPATLQIESTGTGGLPPELATQAYLCILDLLDLVGTEARAKLALTADEASFSVELVTDALITEPRLQPLQDQVEARGGDLTTASTADGRTQVTFRLSSV